ncbi:hypothetical protein [Opitutus sp. ER46]|uniref:hypothetical protein n=1 Tax=Opitutus sp. ER46 TaxID=2161864 RepID=UPI000D2F90FA|nr:hypothetical protein [Opitutus sp. ER46]PTX91587.1 hypothetical protein DB354_17080 [Opitutus sp. ER46]
MKAPLFISAAFTAFLVLPLDITSAVSVLLVASLATLLAADYPARRSLMPAQSAGVGRAKQPLQLAA